MGESIIIKMDPWVVNKKHGIQSITEKLDRIWITLFTVKRKKAEQVGTYKGRVRCLIASIFLMWQDH